MSAQLFHALDVLGRGHRLCGHLDSSDSKHVPSVRDGPHRQRSGQSQSSGLGDRKSGINMEEDNVASGMWTGRREESGPALLLLSLKLEAPPGI